MVFKINVSHKGKTLKLETENEALVGKKIGESLKGKEISEDLDGYDLKITGTSDDAGFAGKQGLEGIRYHRVLLSKGFAMHDKRKGVRLRKTLRGEEISLKTIQINTIVVKEGKKKFVELLPKKEVKTEEAKKE